jgi:RsiW-degrading membrane proteinase PrsW (M82 family)
MQRRLISSLLNVSLIIFFIHQLLFISNVFFYKFTNKINKTPQMSPVPFIIISIAPIVAFFSYRLFHSDLNKETLFLIRVCYVAGIVGFGLAWLAEQLFAYYDLNTIRSLKRILFTSFIVKAGMEQLIMIVLLQLIFFRQKGFSRSYHGLLFAIMMGLGMVTAENVVNVMNNGGKDFILLKGYTSVPAHFVFGILLGFFFGISKFKNMRYVLLMSGLSVAAFSQGVYEFCLYTNDIQLLWIFSIGVIIIAVLLYVNALKTFYNDQTAEGNQSSL